MNKSQEFSTKNNLPSHINFFLSVADFQQGKVTKMPLREAEAIIAKYRNLRSFTWIEVFNDVELNESINAERIHPDKLAIIYLGEKVGYGVVALEEISVGELLIFSGESRELMPKDANNPYLCSVRGFHVKYPEKYFAVDARELGGFASFVMDLPSEIEIKKLKKRTLSDETRNELATLAYQNFEYSQRTIDVAGDIMAACICATRIIKRNELIGCPYLPSARLMFPFYAVFYRSGEMARAEIVNEMSNIAYKEILKRDTSKEVSGILKVQKYLRATKKPEKLSCYLAANLSVLNYLTDEELLACKAACSQSSLVAQDLTRELEKESSTPAEKKEKSQKERELLFLVRESNKKQIARKGSSSLFFASTQIPEYYLQYPGMEKDFDDIGKLHNALGRLEIGQPYLEQNYLLREGESCHSREGGNPFLPPQP